MTGPIVPETFGVEISDGKKVYTIICSKRIADALVKLKEERNSLNVLLLSERELNARLQDKLQRAEQRLSDYSWRDSPGQIAY